MTSYYLCAELICTARTKDHHTADPQPHGLESMEGSGQGGLEDFPWEGYIAQPNSLPLY